MTDAQRENAAPGDRTAEKAEAASAGVVIQHLAKADRGFSIYLPNNPLHEKYFEDFRRRVEAHLEEFGPLHLDIAGETILCNGETIYSNADPRENLAFRMYADGIRTLRVEEGAEPYELHTLVEILGRPKTESDEDDIVTRLWSADLPHIRYDLAEEPPASAAGSFGLVGSKEVQQGALRRYAAELATAPAPPRLPPLAQQVFSLTEQEIEALQVLLAGDGQRLPFEDMIGILEAIVAAEAEVAVLDEFLEIIVRLCGDLLLTARADQAIELLALLARVAARPGHPPALAVKIAAARERVISAEVLAGLSRLLAAGEGIERETLRSLVAALGRSAIEPFCRILGDVGSKETRKVLIDALAEAGQGAPELFLPFLHDARWYLVRNTVYILRRIPGPEVARAVFRCAAHKDQRVRKEVVHYYDETGDPAGESAILGLLADSVQSLRVAAMRSLARRGSRAAAERLLALTTAPGFAERARLERETVWEALGALSPAQVLPILKELLLKRHWFGQAREADDTACACAGLRRIATPEALGLLRRAAAEKRGEAREIVEKTLRAIAPGRAPEARAGGAAGGEANRG